MKRNKTRTTRRARKKSKSKLKIKGFSDASEGGREGGCNVCGRHSMHSAIKTCTRHLHMNMCGGLIGNDRVEGVGGGGLRESKVNAAPLRL